MCAGDGQHVDFLVEYAVHALAALYWPEGRGLRNWIFCSGV